MSAIVRWEEPPVTVRPSRSRFPSHAVAEELRENPGVWALVAVNPSSTGLATHISSAHFAAFDPPGSFEACWRTVDDQRHVYARFVGETPP